MTTFTFSFGRSSPNPGVLAIALIGAVLLACLAACSDWPKSDDQPQVRVELRHKSSSEDVASATLLADLQRNFDWATRGASGAKTSMVALPHDNFSGIGCRPARLSPTASNFRIVLPSRYVDRKGTFAVIVPDGSLRIVYFAYSGEVSTEEIIIPSKTIDWEIARTRNVFDVDARQFDALRPEENVSERLFREAGVYQFAVVNAVDRSLLAVNKTPFKVKAGCVVEWNPRGL